MQVASGATGLNPAEILTPEELAKRLKVGRDWVYNRTRSDGRYKPIPCLRIGRMLRFYWPDVCTWMEAEKK